MSGNIDFGFIYIYIIYIYIYNVCSYYYYFFGGYVFLRAPFFVGIKEKPAGNHHLGALRQTRIIPHVG